MEIAHAEDPVGCPLDAVDRAALDAIDELGRDPGLALRVRLKAGEAVFANNHTVMHARRGFTDRPGDPKRHLLRLWIASHTPRPVRAETRLYPGEVGIAAQPGRTPSYPTGVEII